MTNSTLNSLGLGHLLRAQLVEQLIIDPVVIRFEERVEDDLHIAVLEHLAEPPLESRVDKLK